MQKIYFHNYRGSKKKDEEVRSRETKKLTTPQKVNINKLLNRIKINEVSKRRENLFLLSIVTFIIGSVSILILF